MKSKNESRPEPPHDLSEVAKAEWNRVVEELSELDRLSKIDRSILTLYCRTFSIWHRHAMAVEQAENGAVHMYTSGNAGLSKDFDAMMKCANLLQKLENDMGLTWKSRSKVAETKELPPLIYRKPKQ